MVVIPYKIGEDEYSIFIALGNDSVARIMEYDPAEVNVQKLPPPWSALKLREVFVGYITDADFAKIIELQKADNGREALRLLTRGFKFRPEAGDHDGPYLSTKPDGSRPS